MCWCPSSAASLSPRPDLAVPRLPQLLRLIASAQRGDLEAPDRIYIPRKHGRRRLANDDTIETLLHGHGYASVDPEALGPLRSAQVFSRAHTRAD